MDYLKAAIDDIIFQYRNKEYGAYLLRKKYNGNLVKGFLLSTSLLLLLVYFEDIAHLFGRKKGFTERNVEVNLSPGELNEQQFKVPPPPEKENKPKPKPQQEKKPKPKNPVIANQDTPPIPTADDKSVDPQPSDSTDPSNGQSDSTDGTEDDLPPVKPPTGPVVKLAEQMPSFPGGYTAMLSFIFQNMRYPEKARDMGVEGKVYISFIVEKDGAITKIEIKQDIGTGCGQEAARVVRIMPKWLPGRTEGKNVRVLMTLPVEFKLIDIE